MPVEKLGWFKKKVASIGKHIYYWKLKKINLYAVNSMLRNLVHLYGELNDGDYAKGIRELAAQIEMESQNFISEMIDEPILLGVTMSSVMSKSVEDVVFFATLMFWSMLGKDYKEIWAEPTMKTEEDGTVVIVMQQKKCLFCAEESKLTREQLGDFTTGEILASMFKGILQAVQNYVGNDYEVTARETKCFMRGDNMGEITVWFTPRK
ncbi:MAG: hypothetical protein ACTSVI_15055 [Promethearchaeota archaeon]